MTTCSSAGELALSKLHGLGNDFLVVLDPGSTAWPVPTGARLGHPCAPPGGCWR